MLLFFSPFFGRHRVVLNKGTDGCVESTFVIPQDGYVTKYGKLFVNFFYFNGSSEKYTKNQEHLYVKAQNMPVKH